MPCPQTSHTVHIAGRKLSWQPCGFVSMMLLGASRSMSSSAYYSCRCCGCITTVVAVVPAAALPKAAAAAVTCCSSINVDFVSLQLLHWKLLLPLKAPASAVAAAAAVAATRSPFYCMITAVAVILQLLLLEAVVASESRCCHCCCCCCNNKPPRSPQRLWVLQLLLEGNTLPLEAVAAAAAAAVVSHCSCCCQNAMLCHHRSGCGSSSCCFWKLLRSWPHAAAASRPRVVRTLTGIPAPSNTDLNADTCSSSRAAAAAAAAAVLSPLLSLRRQAGGLHAGSHCHPLPACPLPPRNSFSHVMLAVLSHCGPPMLILTLSTCRLTNTTAAAYSAGAWPLVG
jgi:hypothetical protein